MRAARIKVPIAVLTVLAAAGTYFRLRVPPPERSIARMTSPDTGDPANARFADDSADTLRAILTATTAGAACKPPDPATLASLRVIRDEVAARGDDPLLSATTSLEQCVRCEDDWAGHCFIARSKLGDGVFDPSLAHTLDPDEPPERSPVPPSTLLPNSTR